MNAYFNAMRRYVDFKGRSTRSQFWLFTLMVFVLGILGLIIDGVLGTAPSGEPGAVFYLTYLAHVLPLLAVTVRRLHDINRTGWWILIGFVPIIGQITALVFACTASTPGANQFGVPVNGGIVAAPPPSSASPVSNEAYLDRLEKLAALRSSGAIDEPEFQRMKADLGARTVG